MNKKRIKELVKGEFQRKSALIIYAKRAEEGLWNSEKYFIKKYFTKKGASVLDIGCGTGRTTIPLHKIGFKVTGIDFAPKMIELAKRIAHKKRIGVKYKVNDATDLTFKSDTFDYAFFANQGWTMIPFNEDRLKALIEIERILKLGGIFIFTSHLRSWRGNKFFLWAWQWLRLKICKLPWLDTNEFEFGDRYFSIINGNKIYKKQFIHIPSLKEVIGEIKKCNFEILEISNKIKSPDNKVEANPSPVFYVVKKIKNLRR